MQIVEGNVACRALVLCCCHSVFLDSRSNVRICDANRKSCVTGPVTEKLQGPSTTKDSRNSQCSYGVLVPEFFSATLNNSNVFPSPFNSVCQPGSSFEVWGLALKGSPSHRQGELQALGTPDFCSVLLLDLLWDRKVCPGCCGAQDSCHTHSRRQWAFESFLVPERKL